MVDLRSCPSLAVAGLALALSLGLAGCASAPPTGSVAAKAKKPKIPKNAVFDEATAIAAGKEACLPISEAFAGEHWRAQNQRGVWRVWVTPVHCGGGTCPTYEVHITASDGVAGECRQRVALN